MKIKTRSSRNVSEKAHENIGNYQILDEIRGNSNFFSNNRKDKNYSLGVYYDYDKTSLT